ncbi:alpha-E domain-containing protein [Marinicellulosiphila megalodicopiae]|uniref:alpha-E domain-containing protein n=1 Tax=Marinicellulosiphila megalodicopiae TaxID=2724896 RepID=UPI003BAFAEC1
MLARVAENIYWLGRYIERAENTSRLVKSTYDMMLDTPRSVDLKWTSLFEVLGNWPEQSQSQSQAQSSQSSESFVMQNIIGDIDNISSIYSSIVSTRQIVRNSKELLPQASWEVINNAYYFIKENQLLLETRQGRIRYCDKLRNSCEQFIGIIINNMERSDCYYFFRLGQLIERADMISRVIDSKATLVAFENKPMQEASESFHSAFWLNALEALGCSQSFRRLNPDDVNKESVIRFLLEEIRLPKTIMFSLEKLERLTDSLPNSDEVKLTILTIKQWVHECAESSFDDITEQMDDLQLKLGKLHDVVYKQYFSMVYEEAS